MEISKSRWDNAADNRKRIINDKKEIWVETESHWEEVTFIPVEISPIYGALTVENPWEGNCKLKPWDYSVTAVIPCLNTCETLPVCIELLRLQTERPFIVIIDTGSISYHLEKILSLRAEDVEVHSIALNGVRHPSDYPAMAMDLAMTICRSEYLFATHADCFLRKRTLLDDFIKLCQCSSPVVGYELSPRAHHDWKGMVSHTASMYHMPTMDRIGFGWSLRRLCNEYGIVDYKPDPMRPNWPDTEILGNYILRKNGIAPHLVGSEENQCRTLDENIDHFRSYTAGKMYSPPYFIKAKEWYEEASKEATERIEAWKENDKSNLCGDERSKFSSEILIDSVLKRTFLIDEVICVQVDETQTKRYTKNGVEVIKFGAANKIGHTYGYKDPWPMKLIEMGAGLQHPFGLHCGLEIAKNEKVFFCDSDVFFYTNIEAIFLKYLNDDFQFVGLTHHNQQRADGNFPTVIGLLTEKKYLPDENFFLKNRMVIETFLTPILDDIQNGLFLNRDKFPYGNASIRTAGILDTGAMLYLWCQEKNMNWLSFLTRDCHHYNSKHIMASKSYERIGARNLAYHLCGGSFDGLSKDINNTQVVNEVRHEHWQKNKEEMIEEYEKSEREYNESNVFVY